MEDLINGLYCPRKWSSSCLFAGTGTPLPGIPRGGGELCSRKRILPGHAAFDFFGRVKSCVTRQLRKLRFEGSLHREHARFYPVRASNTHLDLPLGLGKMI